MVRRLQRRRRGQRGHWRRGACCVSAEKHREHVLRCCWSPGAPALPTFSRALVALPPADKAPAPANPGSRSAADTALYAVRSLALGNWLCEMGCHVEASYGTRSGTTDLVRSRMGGGWAGDQMQCCAEFRLTLLWQMHHELRALFLPLRQNLYH